MSWNGVNAPSILRGPDTFTKVRMNPSLATVEILEVPAVKPLDTAPDQ